MDRYPQYAVSLAVAMRIEDSGDADKAWADLGSGRRLDPSLYIYTYVYIYLSIYIYR